MDRFEQRMQADAHRPKKSVDVIASGYEWVCPECGKLNNEIEYLPQVNCDDCCLQFDADFPEHCFG